MGRRAPGAAASDENSPGRTAQRDIVAIGASAGGVEALRELVATLPPEFPASVLVAVHVLPTGTSMLPAILERAGRLPAKAAEHGGRLERGCIYVAPPDYHLLTVDSTTALSHGPRENGHRPALDPLFRSVARAFGNRAVGVILSGTLDDGAAGLAVMRTRGAATIAQDPKDALYAGMPQSAISSGAAEHVVKVSEMADLICRLIDAPVEDNGANSGEEDPMPEPILDTAEVGSARDGEPSGLTCPECGGALWEHQEGELIRFRCHVGHAYSPESMQTEQGRALEAALWSALRSLQEREDLFRRMARRTRGGTATRLEQKAADVAAHIEAIRKTIADLGDTPAVTEEGEEPAA